MADGETQDDRYWTNVNAFLQNKGMEQGRDYLARGRRFAKLDVSELNDYWIIAVRGWLARKDGRKGDWLDR